MIKSITITNYLDESIKMDLRNPASSGFLIRSIDGLGPVKATINSLEVATSDGSIFNSARASSRNIVLDVVFFGNSVEDIRQKSYRYFPLKKPLRFTVETDNRTCYTIGYVESNEPDIFSDQESSKISIVCPESYFRSDKPQLTVFAGTEPAFEFPFSNESATEPLLIMGNIFYYSEKTIEYLGDTDTGFVMTIQFNDPATGVVVYNIKTGESMKILDDKYEAIMGSGIEVGDIIEISTIKKNKYIRVLRDGVYKNIMNALDKNTNWLQFTKGYNTIAYVADTGSTGMQLKIENPVLYEGI